MSVSFKSKIDSSRLESKMTKFLDSATILEWVLKRARKSKKADQFILEIQS